MSKTREKSLSIITSRALDRLGFSWEMIQCRRNFVASMNKLLDDGANIVGSKAEGVTKFTESDIDCLYIPKRLKCVEDPDDIGSAAGTLLMETLDVMPGYTRLKLITPLEQVGKDMAEYFCQLEHGTYLSSSSFVSGHRDFASKEGKIAERAGPSIPGISLLSFDSVTAFSCKCKSLIATWCKRDRPYGWPPKDLKTEIGQMDGMVAPVGYKGSRTEGLEWRICFTLAELKLIHSLNETQIKLYVLLKALTKEVINNSVPDVMTSYFIKNIVFWIAESRPTERFQEHMLLDRLCNSLIYMKDCVESGFLKNYMIPERNLFSGKLTDKTAAKLSDYLEELLNEGPRMVERIPSLYDVLLQEKKNPRIALSWQEENDMDEKLRINCTLHTMAKVLRK